MCHVCQAPNDYWDQSLRVEKDDELNALKNLNLLLVEMDLLLGREGH